MFRRRVRINRLAGERLARTFAARVCGQLAARGWSKRDLAKAAGYPYGELLYTLDGRPDNVTLLDVARLAEALGVPTESLLEEIA